MGMSKLQHVAGNYLALMKGGGDTSSPRNAEDFENVKRLLLLVRDSTELTEDQRGRYVGFCEALFLQHEYYLGATALGLLEFEDLISTVYLNLGDKA